MLIRFFRLFAKEKENKPEKDFTGRLFFLYLHVNRFTIHVSIDNMASLQDIADKVGVSKGTVSLVLNGKSGNRVSPTTQELIKKTACEMHYQINEVARSLRTGITKIIGVIVTDISNEFFGRLTFYIQEEAKKYGYLVIIANSNENVGEMDSIVNKLINKKVDGFIVVPTGDCQSILQKVINAHIPLVQIDRYCKGIEADYVGVNNYGNSVRAVESLIAKGCRRIGLISYGLDISVMKERRQGYVDVMNSHHLLDESLIREIRFENQEEQIEQVVMEFIENVKPLDAIFFCSRRIFITSIKEITKLKWDVAGKHCLLCFDEVEGMLSSSYDIQYVKQPIQALGVKAFNLLLDKIHGGTDYGNYLFDASIESI